MRINALIIISRNQDILQIIGPLSDQCQFQSTEILTFVEKPYPRLARRRQFILPGIINHVRKIDIIVLGLPSFPIMGEFNYQRMHRIAWQALSPLQIILSQKLIAICII